MTMPQPTTQPTLPRHRLATLRAELSEALQMHSERMESPVDSDDDLGVAMQRRSERAARDIRAALDRMDAGSYGLCQVCDGAIASERLEAIPHATTCTRCASPFPRA